MLAESYPCDIKDAELFNDLKDIIILLERALENIEILYNTPKGLLAYIFSIGLEVYNSLPAALQIS